MKYRLYEAPFNNTDKFEKTFFEIKSAEPNGYADFITIYNKCRDLLRISDITESQEYFVRYEIYKLFLKGFCKSLGGVNNKIKRFFDKITSTVSPVGAKGAGMEFGLSQLRFWTQFIEAYNWKEILNPNNIFKQVIAWILKNDVNESLNLHEAGNNAAYKSAIKRANIRNLNTTSPSSNNDNSNYKSQEDTNQGDVYIPKINNFKDFQKLYNMYVNHKLDNFNPESQNPLEFLKGNVQINKQKNQNDDADLNINPDDLSTNDAKELYNNLYQVFNDRLHLNLKKV